MVSSKFKIAVNTATPATNRQLDTRLLDGYATTPDGQWCCVGSVELPTQILLPEYAKEDDRPCTMLLLERATVILARGQKVQVWEQEKPQITTVKEMREDERRQTSERQRNISKGAGQQAAQAEPKEKRAENGLQKKQEGPAKDSYVVRVYDIRDLNVIPYDNVTKAPANVDLARAQLIELVRTTCEDWPPDLTEISEYAGNLVIKQTLTVHEKISKLLKQVRDSRSIQISAEARILLVHDLDWIQSHDVDRLDREHPLILSEDDLKTLMAVQDTFFINAPKVTIFNGANATIEINNFESKDAKWEKPAISVVYSAASDVHRKNVEVKAKAELRLRNGKGKIVDVLDATMTGKYPADQIVVAYSKQLSEEFRFTSKDKVAKDTWVVLLLRNRIIVQKETSQEELDREKAKG